MQQLLSKRIRHRSHFAYVLLVFSYVMAFKISLIYVQGCEKRNPTQIHKLRLKIRSGNLNSHNLDRSGGVEEVSSFKLRQIQLSRSYRGAVEETEAFSIDLLAIERCRDCDNNQLKSSINILVVKRCRVAVELFARRCRAICPQVSSYLSSFSEQLFFTCFFGPIFMALILDLNNMFLEILNTSQIYPNTSKVHFVKELANYNKKLDICS